MCRKNKSQTFSDKLKAFSYLCKYSHKYGKNEFYDSLVCAQYDYLSIVFESLSDLSTSFRNIYDDNGPFEIIFKEFDELRLKTIDLIKTETSYSTEYYTYMTGSSFFVAQQVFSNISSFIASAIVRINSSRRKSIESINQKQINRNIFIVHGREDNFVSELTKELKKHKFVPIIMEQEKHKGMQSSFDKFVQTSSNCSFCIVSLFAYAKVEDEVFYRQNVIFELGYFVNKLGKNNVLILTNETEDDLPSDIKGAMVLKIDNEGKWKKQLLDLLDSSGF